MNYLKVEAISIPAGQEYLVTSYPHDGVFMVNWMYLTAVIAQTVIYAGAASAVSPFLESIPPMPADAGISADTLLKAIAVAQKPELAFGK